MWQVITNDRFHSLLLVLSATVTCVGMAADTDPGLEKEAQLQKLDLTPLANQVSRRFGEMNPAIATNIVKVESITSHIEAMPSMCQLHVEEEVEKLEAKKYDKRTWMEHVVGCDCCRPLVESIWADYTANVSALPHTVVFYDNNSSEIRPEFRPALRDFFRTHLSPNELQVFLIGRASSIGDFSHNERLSEHRAVSIKRFLEGLGTDPERIDHVFFGEDPPSLDEKTLGAYGVAADAYESVTTGCDPEMADVCKMNQSVTIVAY